MLTKKVSDGENLTQPSLPGQEKQEDFCDGSRLRCIGQRNSDAELRRKIYVSIKFVVVFSRTASCTLSMSAKAMTLKQLMSVLPLPGLDCKSDRDPRRCSTQFQSCRAHRTWLKLFELGFPIADASSLLRRECWDLFAVLGFRE